MPETKKARIVISCYYGSNNLSILPVGFSWAQILAEQYSHKYNIAVLLHGECLKYGLNRQTYISKFGTLNPYAQFLEDLSGVGVKIVICDLCLHNDGFNNTQLLKFVKPIAFSIDYIATSQLKGHIVVYDAQLS